MLIEVTRWFIFAYAIVGLLALGWKIWKTKRSKKWL